MPAVEIHMQYESELEFVREIMRLGLDPTAPIMMTRRLEARRMGGPGVILKCTIVINIGIEGGSPIDIRPEMFTQRRPIYIIDDMGEIRRA